MIRNISTESNNSSAWQEQLGGDAESHSSGEQHASNLEKKKRITANSFATILAEVIDAPGYEDAIYWSEDGKSFRVIPKTFTEKVLDQHMKGTKFSSFFRRLIRWGFERVVLDEFPMDAFVFRHEMFQRGQASLLRTLSPYHVSRGKRSVQKSIVKAKSSAATNDKVPSAKAADRAPSAVAPSTTTNTLLGRLTQPPILPTPSIAFPQRRQNNTNHHETALALIRRQQELLLLSQLNNSNSNNRAELDAQRLDALFPPSLLSQRLAPSCAGGVDMDLLAREMRIRDLLRQRAAAQERPAWVFPGSNNNALNAAASEQERVALMSMLMRQEAPPREEARYDELFRLVNLMNRLQQG